MRSCMRDRRRDIAHKEGGDGRNLRAKRGKRGRQGKIGKKTKRRLEDCFSLHLSL